MTDAEKRIQYLAETSLADRCKNAMAALGYVVCSWSLDVAYNRVVELAAEGIAATWVEIEDGSFCVVV